jgi:hypothetical protein
MSHIYFNFDVFSNKIFECRDENELEEVLGNLKEYIEDIIEYSRELEMDKSNIQCELDTLQSQIDCM